MPGLVVVGAQWGDEGKGKVTDLIAERVEVGAPLAPGERVRIGIGKRIIERARHLGAYMQAQFRTEDERRFAERYRTPEAVMRETATMEFLKS